MSYEIKPFILFVTKDDHIINEFPSDVCAHATSENYFCLV
jgi:hypothetical protein